MLSKCSKGHNTFFEPGVLILVLMEYALEVTYLKLNNYVIES